MQTHEYIFSISLLYITTCSISGHIQETTNISRIGYLTIYRRVQAACKQREHVSSLKKRKVNDESRRLRRPEGQKSQHRDKE